MAVPIDYVAAVLYDPAHRPAHHHGARSVISTLLFSSSPVPEDDDEDTWSAYPSDPSRTPTVACVWADPFWSGLTCRVLSPPRQTPVFRLRGTLSPLVVVAPDKKTLCNSLKVHFFRDGPDDHEHAGANIPPTERKCDFLYASAFPLVLSGGARFFGLFNYNRDDASSDPIPGLCLAVTPCGPLPSIPRDTQLLCIRGPDAHTHRRACTLATGIMEAMGTISPRVHSSSFCNMRTFGRDPCCTLFFQDLAQLFDAPSTQLPPALAVYALWGALYVNGLLSSPTLALPLPLLLRVLRDTLACFTLCVVEGIYWADMCLRASVEDQPFPLSFMPATRVFAKDDCEGRATQIQENKRLFKSLHRRRGAIGLARLQAEVRASRSAQTLFRHLPQTEIDRLLALACDLGALLEDGTLDVHTVVADVHFGALQVSSSNDCSRSRPPRCPCVRGWNVRRRMM